MLAWVTNVSTSPDLNIEFSTGSTRTDPRLVKNFELSDYAQSELYRHRLVHYIVCTGAIASYYPDDLPLASLLEKERSNFLLNLVVTLTPPHAKAA